MRVFVKTLTGQTTTLEIEKNEKIKGIKEKIQTKVSYPFYMQRLLYEGKELANFRSIEYYKIVKDSTLHLVLTFGKGPTGSIFLEHGIQINPKLNIEYKSGILRSDILWDPKNPIEFTFDSKKLSEFYSSYYIQKSSPSTLNIFKNEKLIFEEKCNYIDDDEEIILTKYYMPNEGFEYNQEYYVSFSNIQGRGIYFYFKTKDKLENELLKYEFKITNLFKIVDFYDFKLLNFISSGNYLNNNKNKGKLIFLNIKNVMVLFLKLNTIQMKIMI
jgi:hypothetical protein